MQENAASVGYSGTVFAAPEGDGWRVRDFAPEAEGPFCGHATIAHGATLARGRDPGRFRLDLAAGPIALEAEVREDVVHARLWSPPTRHATEPPGLLDAALALCGHPPEDLDPDLALVLAHAGGDHLILPLRNWDLLSRMRNDLEAGRVMQAHGLVTVALIWRERGRLFHARNAFAPVAWSRTPPRGRPRRHWRGRCAMRGSWRLGA